MRFALLLRPSLVISFLAASASGLAILLHAAGVITLTYSVTILAPLSAVALLGALVVAGRAKEDLFLNRLLGGLAAGALGLVAYDLVRLLILMSGVAPFNPFRPIEVYGLLILDRFEDTPLTKAVGWAFHFWNGLAFAAMYTLAVGRGRVLWALGWAMLLEVALLSTYPIIFRIAIAWPFITVSLVGHVAYGLALGVAARRTVRG